MNSIVYFDDKLSFISWGQWAIDSIGAGWPVDESSLDELLKGFEEAKTVRQELQSVAQQKIVMSARLFEFERLYRCYDYCSALKLLPFILDDVSVFLEDASEIKMT